MTKEDMIKIVQSLTGHQNILFTDRGNTAIDKALEYVKNNSSRSTILIPDQAGWLHYQKAPQRFGFEIVEVKTQQGKIDLADLEVHAATAAAIIVQSLAGYFVEQPMQEIIGICKKHGCIVIEDISGSLGVLSSHDADLKVCSFGKDKPVNLGSGGCISSNSHLAGEHAELDYAALTAQFAALKSRVAFLTEQAQKIKRDLVNQTILYPESPAINVVVAFKTDEEKKVIIDYCNANQLQYTLCPRYIRVQEPAVCIEVKRL